MAPAIGRKEEELMIYQGITWNDPTTKEPGQLTHRKKPLCLMTSGSKDHEKGAKVKKLCECFAALILGVVSIDWHRKLDGENE